MSLKSSANRKWIRLSHIWTHFNLFWFSFGCDWRRKWSWFFFFAVATRLFCKTMCTVTAKQHNCQFLVLRRNFQNVTAGFALFRVIETSHYIGWHVNILFVSTCWTIHIFNSLLYFVVYTQFFFLYLVVWNRTLGNNCLLGTKFIFFLAKKKRVLSVFVVFTCSCNLKGTLWTNNQAPHFPQP